MELEFSLLQPVIAVSCHCKCTLLTHVQIVVYHIPRLILQSCSLASWSPACTYV